MTRFDGPVPECPAPRRLPRDAMVLAALLAALSVAAMGVSSEEPVRSGEAVPRSDGPRSAPPSAGRGPVAGEHVSPLPPAAEAAGTGPRSAPGPDGFAIRPVAFSGDIPAPMLTAYRRAAQSVGHALPGCHLPMTLLAAIGKVETGHARGGQVDALGTTVRPILGPVLDGSAGMAAIGDSDGGLLDGDLRWDRAVGPMQFIPSTWTRWATDGNADGVASPHNVHDASTAGGRYLCAGGRDLATEPGLRDAILSYNRSATYVRLVLTWKAAYDRGVSAGLTVAVPDGDTRPPGTPPGSPPVVPPASPPLPPSSQQPVPQPVPQPPPTTVPPPPGPDSPPAPQPPAPRPSPAPPPPGPVTGVVCLVEDGIGTVTGLVGGLLGLAPSPTRTPACPPATPGS